MPRIDVEALRQAANERLADIGERLLGQPKARDRREMRWGGEGRYDLVLALSGPKRGLWYDFSNAEGGDIIALVLRANGGSFVDACDWLSEALALPSLDRRDPIKEAPKFVASRDSVEMAAKIWQEACDGRNTPAERYIVDHRRLKVPDGAWGNALRFHPFCWVQGRRVPALVGLLRSITTNQPGGIQRIALQPNGAAIVGADGKKIKRTLGKLKNHVCKLSPDEDVTVSLNLAEGIESAIGAISFFGFAPTWAAVSADNILSFPVLPGIEKLTVLADRDASGVGQTAALRCCERWRDAGRETAIARRSKLGQDFADV